MSDQVSFSNANYEFMMFQQQHKTTCENISKQEPHQLKEAIQSLSGIIFQYLHYISNHTIRKKLMQDVQKLREDLSKDIEFQKWLVQDTPSNTTKSLINKRFYEYQVKIFTIVGMYSDELTTTFMPNLQQRVKLFRFWNANSFYEQFCFYKGNVAGILASFTIEKHRLYITSLLGFYFAYYSYIDTTSRVKCEEVFSDILSLITSEDTIRLLHSEDKTNSKQTQIRELDMLIHNALLNIFYRCNYSYSEFNIIPKVEKRTAIDNTTI